MKIKGKPGSRERLFEIFQGVNKNIINEERTLNENWDKIIDELKNNVTDIEEISTGPNSKAVIYTFNDESKAIIDPLDSFNRVKIYKSKYDDSMANWFRKLYSENFMSYEKIIKTFSDSNQNNQETNVEENIVDKKEDSDPYGDSSQKFQKPIDYVDKRPVNNNLRTRSRELNKYVRESTDQDRYEEVVFMQGEEASEPLNILMNQGPEQALEYLKQWHSPGSHEGTDELKHGSSDFTHEQDGYVMSWNPYVGYIGLVYDTSEINESEEGERTLKSKSNLLKADLDFSRMADAYKGLLNIKHGEFKNTDVLQQTLSDLSNTLAKYLKNVKGIDVDQEDVQRFFDKQTQPVDSVVENEENSEDEAPALDPEDVDNDGDKLEGGLGDDNAVMEFDPEELLKGIEVEMEHTKDPRIAIEIAIDHLSELDDYYTRLEQMEKQGEEETPSVDGEENAEHEAQTGDDIPGDSDSNVNSTYAIEPPSIYFDNMPDDLKQHGEVLNDTSSEDEELKDAILGYSTQTPNKMGEERDYASREREYHDEDKYKRYQELDSKDFDSLSDEEEEEFFELWKEFN